MTRWLALPLGLALAAAAFFLLAGGADRARNDVGPPLDEIDATSRARLERVLRDAEGR